mmetsp:Transcript_17513/g.29510  ORF Transcript_17513/g.29510 Transcript_17513/m.29510 type:complete len:85 (+) Transcript_17513:1324-1578(+)
MQVFHLEEELNGPIYQAPEGGVRDSRSTQVDMPSGEIFSVIAASYQFHTNNEVMQQFLAQSSGLQPPPSVMLVPGRQASQRKEN